MQINHIVSTAQRGSRGAGQNGDDSASSRIKTALMDLLREMHRARGLTQVQAARLFGVSQPRISHLTQNRTNRFTVDALINMLAHAGIRLSLTYEAHRNDADSEGSPSRT
jgi:predicted XRE-type DNA-binding protein